MLTQVLSIVYRTISTFLVRRAGLRVGAGARTGAVTLIQRFGSALNLNPLRADSQDRSPRGYADVEVQRHPEERAYGGLRARKQYRGVKMPVAPPAT